MRLLIALGRRRHGGEPVRPLSYGERSSSLFRVAVKAGCWERYQWHGVRSGERCGAVPFGKDSRAVDLLKSQGDNALQQLRTLTSSSSSIKRDGVDKEWSDEVSRNLVLLRLLSRLLKNISTQDCPGLPIWYGIVVQLHASPRARQQYS